MTFTVEPAPDYVITTTGNVITVTDSLGNTDTLTISAPSAGNIKFAAAGRNFSVNNGPLIVGDSGNISLTNVTDITVNAAVGNDTVNVGGFSGTSFPNLTINGGDGNDSVNFSGDITFGSGKNLNLNLQNDSGTPGADQVNFLSGANVITTGTGTITVKCSRHVSLDAGASLETANGNLLVEANLQATPSTGTFNGVALTGAGTLLRSTGSGTVTVTGVGGNDAGGAQQGVVVVDGAKITSNTGALKVTGTGGASTGLGNRGIAVTGTNAAITSTGSTVEVIGTGGPLGTLTSIGVSILNGGAITSDADGVSVTGLGAGAAGSASNDGVEISGANSRIASPNYVLVEGAPAPGGTFGPGGGFGLRLTTGAAVTVAGGQLSIVSDSVSIDGTSNITATNADVLVQTRSATAQVTLGGSDATGVLGLTNAELNRITANFLSVGPSGSGIINVSNALSVAHAHLAFARDVDSATVRSTVGGTDLTLSGSGKVHFAAGLRVAITSPDVDAGLPQFKVVGAVALEDGVLDLTGTTFAGTVGQSFTILDNDGGDAISGTFKDLPEGAYVPWPPSPNLAAKISYVGGTGNDVVLTLVTAAQARTVTTTASRGAGSLRGALKFVEGNPGAETITFAPGFTGPITLNEDLVILDPAVTIDGTALPAGLTIDAGPGTIRHFSIGPGAGLTLRRVSLINGNGEGMAQAGLGGSIYCEGNLTLSDCTFSNNVAFGEDANNALGGAIYFAGPTLTAVRCTFFGNTAAQAGTATQPAGGALYTTGGATLTDCTFQGNTTGIGGAICNLGTLKLTHCTCTGNSATFQGGGLSQTGASAMLVNTILAGNSGNAGSPNFYGPFSGSGNLTTGDPRLAPLANNGGPTKTMALLPGSPALDGGTVLAPVLDLDQRGFPRNRDGALPTGALPDIGAYEAQSAPFVMGFDLQDINVPALANADVAGAPGYAQGFWNALSGNPGATNGTRFDGIGQSFAIQLWWKGPNTYLVSGAADTPDKKLMFGYLDSNGAGDGTAATDLLNSPAAQPYVGVAGLPASAISGGYKVVVYADGSDTLGRVGKYWLTSNRRLNPATVAGEDRLTPFLYTADYADFSGTYTRATATSDAGAATAGGNYLVFEGLTEPGFYVRAEEGSFPAVNPRAPINTVQISRNEIIAVTTTADENDPTGTTGQGVSLREALRDAPPGSGIIFDPALSGQTIVLGAPLEVTKNVTIDAGTLANGVVISGNSVCRVFRVGAGVSATFRRLKITRGFVSGSFPDSYGAGLFVEGAVVLTECALTENSAFAGGAGYVSTSGQASVTLQRCEVSANQASFGGAFQMEGSLLAVASTFAQNTASQEGGAFSAPFGRPVVLRHCTVSANAAPNGGGASGTAITLENSIVSGNTSQDLSSPPTNIGNNMIGANAMLAPLGAYGGFTRSMALRPGSPVRDAAVVSTAFTDQRGNPLVGTADLGAYEAGTLNDFDAWVYETLPAAATPAQRAPDFDYDGDGLKLLQEYATLTSGTVAEPGTGFGVTRNTAGTLATLVMPRRANASDIIYVIERSTNLTSWAPAVTVLPDGTIVTQGGVSMLGADGVSMTFTDSFISGKDAVFYRFRVSQF
jgi:hypothetical protein